MRKFLLTTVAFGLLAAPAMAADLAPVYKASAPVCIWCGFYVGLNAGGTWSDSNSLNVTTAAAQDFEPEAGFDSYAAASAAGAAGKVPGEGGARFLGGGQIGYNWLISGAWLGGIETDLQGVVGNGSGNGTLNTSVGPINFFTDEDTVTTTVRTTKQLDYFGTLRGRFGYLFGPTFLAYGTGGLAYGGVKASTSIGQTNNDCVISFDCIQPSTSATGAISQTRIGWTAGAGMEWLFATRWSAKVEYLYYDLGSVTFANTPLVTGIGSLIGAGGPAIVNSTSTADFKGNIVRVGVNYHWY